MFVLSISFGRGPAQAPGWLWNPLVLLHLLQQLEPDEADMVCRTADLINRSRREHNWRGMPVMPDEVEWIIPPGAADPTSGSLRKTTSDRQANLPINADTSSVGKLFADELDLGMSPNSAAGQCLGKVSYAFSRVDR